MPDCGHRGPKKPNKHRSTNKRRNQVQTDPELPCTRGDAGLGQTPRPTQGHWNHVAQQSRRRQGTATLASASASRQAAAESVAGAKESKASGANARAPRTTNKKDTTVAQILATLSTGQKQEEWITQMSLVGKANIT